MTLVSGELKLVTDNPEVVSQVWLRAPKERLHGTGMVTTGSDSQPVKNGVVSFSALPGPLVMVLLSNGIPGSTVRLLVPDKANATLRECIEAVGLADDGELSALEELALETARIAAQIASADRLEAWASETAAAAEQAQISKDEANDAANRAGVHEFNAKQYELGAKQSESSAKQHDVNAQSAAMRAADNVRDELHSIAFNASGFADSAADSAAEAKTSETNSKAYEASALSSAERAEFAAEETIQQVAGDFATRNYVDTQTWDRGVAGASIENLDQLSLGSWGVASTSVANKLGLPGTLGNITVGRIATGKSLLYRTMESGNQKHSVWVTSITGGVVAPWKRIDNDDDTDAGAPGLKTVGVALTAGSALNGTPGRCRVLAQVKAPVTRWRVHIESRRQVSTSTADFTLGAVSVGKHSGNGNITGTTLLKSGDTSISGSSEWVSRWVTDDLSDEVLIDFTVSGTGLYSYQAGAWRWNGSTWEVTKAVPAAVWIEVETYAETPVVAMIGDSTGAGQGADRPVHESALHVAARKHRFIPMNYSYPGSTMQSMTNPEHHIYKRWAHLSKPDSVVIQSGSNDIHGGNATGELQTRFNNLAELARGISPVVIGSTVKARYPNSGDFAAALTAHNAYVKTQPAQTRDYLDFYAAVSPSGTVAAADAADAAHLSTSGHQKLATAFDNVVVARPAWVDSGIDSFAGAGSPEGKIAAPVGVTYTDTAATNGAIRWVKAGGTGNTGWVVEYGDTGWRLIPNFNAEQEGQIYIRRVTNTCSIRISGYINPGNYATHMASIPAGFRPGGEFYGLIVSSSASSTNSIVGSYNSNTLSWTRDVNGGFARPGTPQSGELTYSTTNPWPATLPGTPL